MLALRLARRAHPVVQLRRLLVAAAAGGTGFLLLCALGHAMTHPHAQAGSVLRLAWCLAPAAATVYFAVTVARTDPGTRPRPGLSAIGLGPGRLMAVSAVTTALSTVLGSLLALLFFLHLRGDLTGMPFDGAAADVLAAGHPLPLPAALTLLALVPAAASVATALVLRPEYTGARPTGLRTRFMAYDTFAIGRRAASPAGATRYEEEPGDAEDAPTAPRRPAEPTAPRPAPGGLPWGITVLAVGLAVEMYAGRSGDGSGLSLPGGFADSPAGVLGGWMLTAVGLVLTGPGLTHLTGRLLQSIRPGALRLLSGRVLQEEARRIGRPLGVVCAVASGAYAMVTLSSGVRPAVGPLTTLGALVVAGCAVLTLATAAVEARRARADTTAALVRLGAPSALPRQAALLRAGALLTVFGPLTWTVAQLAALPLAA
ncbi:hypothetical protein QBA57_10345 [Streptomyces scabiei]|uniref:hypothetical protein n=1 Tax=Streptomyces scabiei TaxID=1930 RepID=UPI001B305C9D|nr:MULTISPECIES: hypothetical protein [Streptomyces]MBP5860852.1 hypothetical protein [Streptomyces sp. LBUM 1484]MBP5870168.1 hypothetical protein [Streptomyces sp. LBUM 1485]MBP5878735.1 hypothetical protein [Streptomyces sp. LBUM 1477]MBP5902565.1 hypothetical protein [Streptomyces sp. LBUM 1488]MDW8476158.1 hypothetical protein [Streptomyces scabiei]